MNMEIVTQAISSNPILAAFLLILPLIGMVYTSRRLRAIKTAEWIVTEGQYQKIPESHLEAAIMDAETKGYKATFLQFLTKIRIMHGHQEVRIGHLYWIWDQIEKGVQPEQVIEIPSFQK